MDAKIELLKDTFQKSYSHERFLKFSIEFFSGVRVIDTDASEDSIPYEYRFTAESYRHVATYSTDGDTLDVFAVKLRKGRTVERARSMQRSFIAKLLDKATHDAAIVAFYTDDDPRWRLSFIRLEYERIGIQTKRNITPAKRFSYLVGETEPCHTAMEQLLPIFRDDDYRPTLDRIEEAFSVERVTKDFYEQYKNKYYELKEDYLDKSNDFNEEAARCGFTSEQFAKKLMGQLAFLYFLQKKGWLGIPVLPRQLTEKAYNTAFYKSKASRVVIPQIYKHTSTDEYKLSNNALQSLSDDDADIAAGCFKSGEWGSGKKDFIRTLFENRTKTKSFFEDYLEPFYYEALNRKRGKNNYYKRFNCKIPFLNGGLFEPLEGYDWQHNSFEIPDSLFSNKEEKGERNADGILDIFDRYNFTMNEDEPLEREVAVDPEMLGKIFENLLDAKDRKSKGAFYTPREIVHYMCAESLVNYLVNKTGIPYDDIKKFIVDGDTLKDEDYWDIEGERRLPQTVFDKLDEIDKALETIKVADPAVGSGAFPLGMVSEIVKARTTITYYMAGKIRYAIGKFDDPEYKKLRYKQYQERRQVHERRNPYRLKWEAIQNSIYAVDIEASAVDIAKLRLWLSLVVEEDLTPTEDEIRWDGVTMRDPHPLPNLDYNIMCGNSLIDEFEGIQLFDDSLLGKKDYSSAGMTDNFQLNLFADNMNQYLDDLQREQERLFGEQNQDTKKSIKKNIDRLIDSIIRAKLERDNNDEGLQKYEEVLKQNTKPYFLWKLEFARVFRENGGFDVVVGNPPYVGESGHKEIFRPIAQTQFGKEHYRGKMDLFYFFFHKALDILKESGHCALITTNYYLNAYGARGLREDFRNRAELLKFVNFNELRIFESALGQHNIITFLRRSDSQAQPVFCCITNRDGFADSTTIRRIISWKDIETKYFQLQPNELFDSNGNIVFREENSIFTKMRQRANYYIPEKSIGNGIDILQESVTDKHIQKIPHLLKGAGIFAVTDDEIPEMGLNDNEKLLLKPYYTSEQISKYAVSGINNKWIIYTNRTAVENISCYPNIIKHLDNYKEIITSDNKPYGLHRARTQSFFEGRKILSLRMTNEPNFTYADVDTFVTRAYLVIKPDENIDILSLVGVLNSKIVHYWLFFNGKRKGQQLQVDKEQLSEIPIHLPSKDDNRIQILVKQVINTKVTDPAADTSVLEAEIDRMVYELYGLTDDEIKIVEGAVR